MAMIRHSFVKDVNQVLFEGNSYVKKIILNRPQKLNCINHHMISEMTKKLKAYEIDPEVKVVVLKGNGKAFCAGGDVVASYISMVAGHWSHGGHTYKKNLILYFVVATYGKPVVALIDGIVMGAGAGLSMNGAFKIVTENTVFAMPETIIGHFVDVGASHFLSRLPGFFGTRIRGEDMVACGLATHFVLSKDLHLVESALDEVTSSDTNKISEIISKFEHKPNVKQDGVFSRLEIINKCFSRKTVEEILSSLEIEAGNRADKWVLEAIKSMKAASPISLKISLKSIREGRVQELDQCLAREYNIFCHIMRRTVSIDFFEGVRAMLLDKDENPKWEPARLELVSDEMVGQCFSSVGEDDWESLQLPARSSSVDIMRPKI
ncbi:PREDICTED: 3-hydroxyisobutyryl-CoA hydrolase 1-like isoform X2 [Populus euphratica]|uniref:3-hydroxyisobutyryl-CoA hydrolase n=1 Tax=Populus euphratica TaxID=75702 RepID=A0AAJ6TDD0_POPEU|nr:PREDICTED: 3-hydroxyisobutyryl-CoA hydrolase 1-like isoform X2 [Populus euphratica]